MTSEENITFLLLKSIKWAMKQLYIAIFNAEKEKKSIILIDLIKQLDLGDNFEKALISYLEDEMTFNRYPSGPFTKRPEDYLAPSAVCNNLRDFLELFYWSPSISRKSKK